MVRRVLTLVFSAAVFGALLTAPAQADTNDPGSAVVPGSAWFEGQLVNNWGLNCSTAIIGSAYSEPMTQAVGMFGGDAAGGVPRVNQTYYLAIRLSEPGNPCGVGASVPEVRLRLPKNTSLAVDQSHPVRCFGTRRFQNTYMELTNGGDWYIDLSSGRITGPWCQAQPRLLGDGSYSVGTPALANGVFQMIFVPVRSSTPLTGEPAYWEIHDPSTYEGAVSSRSLVYVFNTNVAGAAFFMPERAAIPYWDKAQPDGQRNRVEFFANLYTANRAGYLCYELRQAGSNTVDFDCNDDPSYDGTVTAGSGLVQVTSKVGGPNGGYSPLSFLPGGYDKDYTIQWFFKTSRYGGSTITSSNKIAFHSLAGPDTDGDGVVDVADKCPGTAGTAGNSGCPPSTPADTDGDGVVGVADKCPQADGKGSLDGCPGSTGPGPTPSPQKTMALPKSLRQAKAVKSTTPSVCKVTGKGAKARVVVVKSGTCVLKGRKGKKVVKAKLRV